MPALRPVRADAFRIDGYFGGRARLLKLLVRDRTFRMIYTLRACQSLAARGAVWRIPLLFAKVAHRITTGRCSADLPAVTSVGPGVVIQHGWGLVVNPGATIGANVTLFHGVTIGQADSVAADGSRTTRYPVIEDDVWIGPNVTVVGGVVVGRGARLMAGALVTRDVPARSIVLGNPSSVVKNDCLPDVVNPVDLTLFGYPADYEPTYGPSAQVPGAAPAPARAE